MSSAPNDRFLSLAQDTNQFLVYARIEPHISYTTIRDFTNWANWNPLIFMLNLKFMDIFKPYKSLVQGKKSFYK